MKHVFFIHSHTSFLVAMGILDAIKVSERDVLFLTARNYRTRIVEVPYRMVDIEHILRLPKSYHFSIFKQKSYIKAIDQFIAAHVQGDYYAYIPHVASYGFQVIASNKHCRCVNLCQESAYSFFQKERPTYKLYGRRILLSLTNRIWAQTNWYPPQWMYNLEGGVKTWAVNGDYFAPLKRAEQHVIRLPKFKLNVKINEEIPIFLFEAAVDQHSIEEGVYLDGCRALIEKYGEDTNYVKFHPAQTEGSRLKILKLYGQRKVEILSDDIPFEMIIAQCSHLKIYGFHTSLIKFAKEAGHQVVSYEKYLIDRSVRFRNFVNSHS